MKQCLKNAEENLFFNQEFRAQPKYQSSMKGECRNFQLCKIKKYNLPCKLLSEATGRCAPPMEGHKPRKKWNTGKPEIHKKKEEKKFQDVGQEKFQDHSCVAALEATSSDGGRRTKGSRQKPLKFSFLILKEQELIMKMCMENNFTSICRTWEDLTMDQRK